MIKEELVKNEVVKLVVSYSNNGTHKTFSYERKKYLTTVL